MDAVNYNFDTLMYLDNAKEEHVVTYRIEAVKAARDFLDGIAIVTQGRLPRALISDNQLREILGKVDAMVKGTILIMCWQPHIFPTVEI